MLASVGGTGPGTREQGKGGGGASGAGSVERREKRLPFVGDVH